MKTPGVHGYVKSGFEEVKNIFSNNLETGLEKGGSFAAYYRGELVVNIWGGEADGLCKREWKKDTVSCFYSTTKSISSVVIAHLVDRGYLKYEEPISTYWPEFSENGKDNITLKDYVSNKAGLVGCEEGFLLSDLRDNPRKLGNVLAKQKPLWPPGKFHGYHPMTFALYLDQIVRRVDPKFRSLAQYFHEEIAQPFELDLYIGLPKPQQYRCAKISAVVSSRVYNEKRKQYFKGHVDLFALSKKDPVDWKHINSINNTDFMEIPSGSSHGFGTAEAMAKFHSILANGGVYKDRRLLSESLIECFKKPLSWGVDLTFGQDDIYSLGTTLVPAVEGDKVTYQIGHGGFGGQMALADCDYCVGWAYLTNHLDILSGLADRNSPTSMDFLTKTLYNCIQRLENKHVERRTFRSFEELQSALKSKL